MARVAFIQLDYLPLLGVGILVNVLRGAGHTAETIFARDRHFVEQYRQLNPTVAALSLTSGKVKDGLAVAAWVKNKHSDVKVLLGGPHPTVMPEIAKEPAVDFVIRGEGETALTALAAALDENRSFSTTVPNLVWKNEKGELRYEPMAPPVADLDDLPFPDWSGYFAKPACARFYRRGFTSITSRGCANRCTYCTNRFMLELYQAQRYIRRRSVGSVMAEIEEAKRRYHVRSARYEDDNFALDPDFLRSFTEASEKGQGVPFSCNATAVLITEEVGELLRRAGCYQVSIGLECGDPAMRREVLGRNIDDRSIFSAVEILKRQGIMVQTYNLFGLPGETLEQAMATWRMNRRLRPSFAWCSIYQPYPGTELYRRLAESGRLPQGDMAFPASYFQKSVFSGPEIAKISALQKLTQLFLWARVPESIVRRLIHIGDNRLYTLLFWMTYFIGQVRTKKLSLIGSLLFTPINRPQKQMMFLSDC